MCHRSRGGLQTLGSSLQSRQPSPAPVRSLAGLVVGGRVGWAASPAIRRAFRELCHTFRRGELPDFFTRRIRELANSPRRAPHRSKSWHSASATIQSMDRKLRNRERRERHCGAEVRPQRGSHPSRARSTRRAGRVRQRRGGRQSRRLHSQSREFTTRVRGLFLFIADLVQIMPKQGARRQAARLAQDLSRSLAARLGGSQALVHRALEPYHGARRQEGVALFCGLMRSPKRAFCRNIRRRSLADSLALLGSWHTRFSESAVHRLNEVDFQRAVFRRAFPRPRIIWRAKSSVKANTTSWLRCRERRDQLRERRHSEG